MKSQGQVRRIRFFIVFFTLAKSDNTRIPFNYILNTRKAGSNRGTRILTVKKKLYTEWFIYCSVHFVVPRGSSSKIPVGTYQTFNFNSTSSK